MYRFRDTLPINTEPQTVSGDLVQIDNSDEMGVVDSLKVALEPIQDLNGYDKPWVGGAGKNKLQVTASSQTVNGVTFTVNADGSVKVNGTATANTSFALVQRTAGLLASGNYLLNGNANLDSQFLLQVYSFTKSQNIARCTSSADASFSVDANEELMVVLYVFSGKTVNNLTVCPMIRLASETDATYAPYSNICPISGHDDVDVWDDPVYGGTVAWNQLISLTAGNLISVDASRSFDSSTGTWTFTATNLSSSSVGWYSNSTGVPRIANHVLLICADVKPSATVNVRLGNDASYTWTSCTADKFTFIYKLMKPTTAAAYTSYSNLRNAGLSEYTIQYKNLMLFDLTQMFGTSKAGEIYAMEQSETGSGVAYFKSLFSLDYYEYNSGETTCVSAVNGDEYRKYTTALGRTVYGGTLDVVSGELSVTHKYVTFDGSSDEVWNNYTSGIGGFFCSSVYDQKVQTYGDGWCNMFPTSKSINKEGVIYGVNSKYIFFMGAHSVAETVADWRTWLASNPIEVVYELAKPQTYQLTPQQIDLLLGANHLWSDGEISVTWHRDLKKIRILPTEACSINGQYLEDVVEGYRTLYTKGRESLGAKLETYSIGTADGEKFKNKRYPARTITVGFQLIGANPQDFRRKFNDLNNLLSIEEADFIFNDETDKFFSGYPIMDASVEAGQDSVKGEWKIYCTYPFKRSVEPIKLTMEDATVTDTTATFTIDYKGARPARPVLKAKFAGAKSGGSSSEDGDCGFVAFMDGEENIIQLGNPEILDLDEYVSAETFINKEFVNVSDWTRTGGHTYKGTVTGSVSTSDATDAFWNGGAGQTQTYAKPSYGSGSDLHGAILWKNTAGAVNFTMNMVHRICCANPSETGVFECGAYNHETGVLVAGFIIDKSANGTTGIVRYIVNDKQVGTDQIDLSYYNTHFGYCNRTPVYVEESYYDPYVEEIIIIKRHKKKKKIKRRRYITKSKIHWWARTRTVLSGWNYTQSNLNSSIQKDGSYVYFQVGNLPMRTFNVPSVAQVLAHDASVYMGTYGTALNTNMIHSLLFRRDAGVPFAEQPNVFTSGDIVEADCNEATVYIYRDGSIGGHLEPQYGALGNDWEDFLLTSGTNVIRATWSDWVNPTYKPTIEIEYNEVFI